MSSADEAERGGAGAPREAQPSFSIVVPTHGRPRPLAACLEAIGRLDYPRDRFEVIVVDDAGAHAEAVQRVVDRAGGALEASLLRRARCGGPGVARNTGAAAARGRYLAFTDDDCAPDPGWLRALAARLQRASEALVGGRTVNALTHNRFAGASQLVQDLVYAHYNAAADDARFFATNNLALPRAGFEALGGFDPSFVPASEDRDLCDRWRHAGGAMAYAADALVHHAHPLTLGGFVRQHFRYGRGAARYHRARARRGSGRMRDDVGFHLSPATWRLALARIRRRPGALPLLALWQLVNAAGFGWELLASRRRAPQRLSGCGG